MQPQNNPFGPGPNGAPDPALLAFVAVFVVGFLAVWLTVMIFFLLSLSKCLHRVDGRNRTMEPGQVWLNLIPCFNLFWAFVTVNRIAESLENEFYDRRLRRDGDFGKGLGTTTMVLNLLGNIPYLGLLFGLAALVCFILYWVKIAGYSRQLAEDADYGGDDDRDRDDDSDDDDRDDDRPRRRGRGRDDDYDDRDDDDRPRGRRRGEPDDDR